MHFNIVKITDLFLFKECLLFLKIKVMRLQWENVENAEK